MTMSHVPDKMSHLPAAGGKVEESQGPWLPPGFRFHPTDEELVTYYLTGKVRNSIPNVQAITEVDLNKCEPWDLPAKAKMGEKEWYFFSLRDRKYPTGMRTNRATEAGYWKATGKDREVMSSRNNTLVGMKKTLVFYRGRAPKGEKTNWIMHEYRIEGGETSSLMHSPKPSKDEWVVCRIFQKNAGGKKNPMECNRSSSYTTDPQGRSSLPALLESPNPNSVEESDTCLIDGNYQTMDNGNNNNMGGGGGSKSSNNSWGNLKLEDALESLQGGKNGSGLPRYPSFLLDILPDFGATTAAGIASSIKVGGAASSGSSFGPKLSRQDTFNLQHAQQLQQYSTLKYLSEQPQRGGAGMNSSMRPCKAEPYHGGEEDEAQSRQRSSMLETCNWVGDHPSSGGFSSGEASAAGGGLQSLGSEAGGVSDLENAAAGMFRYNRAALFPEGSNSCADIVENLWAY